MFTILANRTYRHLLSAQIIALVGTGLATVALGLLAFELAGGNAGAVLGTALAIKMIAYIGIAPVVGAFADRLPRRAFLVAMDLVRAAVALSLPFVDQIWQIYVLIFVLQSASAAFTPTFQATIPDVLPDEGEYTRALSLSRLAYDMESLISPILAAALLSVISFHWLFAGTSIGFICSALFVVSVVLPRSPAKPRKGGIWAKTTRGLRIYLKTPRLKGLLALSLASAAASSMVIVNTVVIVRGGLGFGQREVALTLAAYGSGSMLAALFIPRMLDKVSDRTLMVGAAALLTAALAAMAVVTALLGTSGGYWQLLLAGWFVLGIAYSASVTPSGRLLRRSANAEDRPAAFAAQFALSHGCWLITYPLAGQIGAGVGQIAAFAVLALVAGIGTVGALLIWPSHDPELLAHSHDDLPPGHEHLFEDHAQGKSASHAFVIDDIHPNWPRMV
ncbi:MFS transporter [Sphingobium subterraneum]|uniref:H+ antiporter protein n=1 Tax=Sphingobium subterraneum TaxID=627688 RepID=A0A841J443_9SPHN|nr:MFS transporter [Sphingobium subterraneum]MBB6125480.1 H+ antiporter protein [Sphingobium subterraneum]